VRYLLLLAVLLAGCATSPPQVTSSTPAQVIIQWDNLEPMSNNIPKVTPIAEKECQLHKRHARYVRESGSTSLYFFNCVE